MEQVKDHYTSKFSLTCILLAWLEKMRLYLN